jgi:hypothetical protein
MTEDLATAAAHLAEVLTAENAALAALDLPRAGAMLAAKTLAVDALVAACRGAGGAFQGALRGVGGEVPVRLRVLVEENQRLLANAVTAQGRVIGIIARALPRALHDPAAMRYGAQGRATPAPRMSAFAVSSRA